MYVQRESNIRVLEKHVLFHSSESPRISASGACRQQMRGADVTARHSFRTRYSALSSIKGCADMAHRAAMPRLPLCVTETSY